VRDIKEYYAFREYIHLNPVKRGLASLPEEYPFSSARPGFNLDRLLQRLNPVSFSAEAAPR